MRILMLIHSLRRGGAERIALELALGLQDRGHEVAIAAWLDVDEYPEARYAEIPRYFILASSEYRWIGSIPKSAKVLRDLIVRFKPDVIQIHTPNVAWLAAWANTGIRCIHVLHGYGDITREGDFVALFIRYIHRLLAARMTTTFVTVSESMRAVAARYFAVDMGRIYAIPNGIDLKNFPFHSDKPKGRCNILMLGTLSPNKGQRLGVHAFRSLLRRFPEANLLIVGEGKDRAAIESLIAEFDIAATVRLAGRRNDIASVFAESDVLWQLSESEAMPMVVLEAMASGVPVVGFDVRGTRDAVAHGETGYLVAYGDIEAVDERTIYLLTNDVEYRRMATNSRARVEQCFVYGAMVRGHERVIVSQIQ